MTADDTVRVTRVRDLLTRLDLVRDQLAHALDDPIPAPPKPPETPQPPKRPGPDNTGWARTGAVLAGRVDTRYQARTSGEVIYDTALLGGITVYANDVTIARSKIKASDTASPSDYPVKIAAGVTGLIVEDTEIDGNGRTSLCVGFKGYTLLRCNVHGAAGDLLRADGNVHVEDSWLHDIVRVPGGHHDAIQTLKGSGVTLLRNTIDIAVHEADGHVDYMNSCYTISAQAPVSVVTIKGNWLNGGNYALYLGANDKGIPVSQVIVQDNVFGPDVRPNRAITAKADPLLVGNVDHTGKAI